MEFLSAMDISTTGLITQRYRMNIAAENLANIESTRTAKGGPYRRKQAVISAVGLAPAHAGGTRIPVRPGRVLPRSQRSHIAPFLDTLMGEIMPALGGARVVDVVEDNTPFKTLHRPGHPDADQNGHVLMPNVNTVLEMADILSATRAYEANITAFSAAKAMVAKALELAK